MKRWMGLLAAFLLIVCCAFALAQEAPQIDITTPRLGLAVAAPEHALEGGTAALYELPDTESDVQMAYYSGSVLEVLRIEGSMVKVQCGAEGASVMGYMRAQDLRYGAQAMREVPRCFVRYTVEPAADIYSYFDEQSERRMQAAQSVQIEVAGESESGWGHLLPLTIRQTGDWIRSTPDRGFIRIEHCRDREWVVQKGDRFVWPLKEEMTFEEARARAMDLLLQTSAMREKISEAWRSREVLETHFWSDVRLRYDSRSKTVSWEVFLQAGEDHRQNFTIYMDASGEPEEMSQGNG